MFGQQEQLKHYQAVKQRIAAGARPEYERPLQVLPPLPYEKPVARMRVPTLEEIDARRAAAEKMRAAVPERLDLQARVDRILREVAAKHSTDDKTMTVEHIVSHARFRPIMLARREAAWRLHAELNLPNGRIAGYLNKDHSSIQHGLHKYAKENGLDLTRANNPSPLPEHRNAAD